VRRYEVNLDNPVDTDQAIKNFGSIDLFYSLLAKYENITLIKDVKDLATAIEDLNYEEIRN
jgi:hypothetical protein